jgi:hypothetical protein
MPKALLSFCFLSLALLFAGCKKNHDGPPRQYQILLQSGSGQSDTIGRILKNVLTFSVLKDNQAIREGYVRVITMDCDNSAKYTDYRVVNYSSTPPVAPFEYSWQLNQTVGVQTLKVILMDSVKNPKDSLTVTATGIAPSAGWHISGCIPISTSCVAFAQLPSGRIFTALHQEDYPYYSEDNGSSWHAITSFPLKRQIASIVTTKEDEVFVSIPYIGIYYSRDRGQSWQQRSTGISLTDYYGDLQCTATGILYTRTAYLLYYSTDKGLTWQLSYSGLPAGSSFVNFCSMTDGTIITTLNGDLVKSKDGGPAWYYVTSATYATSLLVDSQNYIYMGTPIGSNNSGGVYVSKDTGQTWSQVYDASSQPNYDKSIYQLTKKNGFFYFYASGNNLLTRTSDFSAYTQINPPVPIPGADQGRVSYRYIVTNDNHFILSTEQYGLFYQTP